MTGLDLRRYAAAEFAGASLSAVVSDASLVVVAAVLLLPTVGYPVGVDAAVFAAVADGVARGLTPYIDLWDHKPPGIYLVGATVVRIFSLGSAWSALWTASVIAIAGTAMFVKRIVARQHGLPVAFAIALVAVWTLASTPLALGGGHTETIAVLPLAAATYLVAAQPRTMGAYAAGALVGLAGCTSLQSLLVTPALLWLMGGPRSRILEFLAGMTTTLGLVALWLVESGAMPAAYDALVTYNREYASSSGADQSLTTSIPAAATVVIVLAPLLLLSLIGLLADSPAPRWRIGGWLWVGSSLAIGLVVGRFYSHYATLLVPALALLSADGLAHLLRTERARFIWHLRLVCLASAVALAILVDVQYGSSFRATAVRREGVIAQAAAHVAQRTSPDARVFVWGNTPQFYSVSGRMPATKWTYVLPLLTPGYGETAAADLLAELKQEPPAAVIDSSGIASAPAAPGIVAVHPFAPRDGRTLDNFTELRAFVRSLYTCQQPSRTIAVCIRRSQSIPSGGDPTSGS